MEIHQLSAVIRRAQGPAMPRLSSAQTRCRDRVQAAARTALLPHAFAEQVIRELDRTIGFDDARFVGLDPGSRLINRLLFATATDTVHRLHWMQSIYLAESGTVPYFAPQVLIDYGIPVITYRPDQDLCFGLTDSLRARVESSTHKRVFHETETPTGGSLRLVIVSGNRAIGMIDCMRRGATRPFTASDFAFVRLLRKPIGDGLARASRLEMATHPFARVDESHASGVVIVNDLGTPIYQSRRGSDLLERVARTDHSSAGILPTAVQAALARCRADLSDGGGTIYLESADGPVTIEATRGQHGQDMVLIIAPIPEPARASIPATWNLTQTQREVTRLLVEGKRNREIAAGLMISETTVETHLGNIYERLGVAGRGGLLARLFQEMNKP
jgi:DNA-binding CsgD family transcriptional regulator